MKHKRKLLLVEDDVNECKKFSKFVKNREDVEFVGITNSSIEAINYVRNCNIDAVILDIGLERGRGSGIEFINCLNQEKKINKPMIVVTTDNIGRGTDSFLKSNGIEYIFFKGENYSHERVLEHILSILPHYEQTNTTKVNIGYDIVNLEEEYEEKLSSSINKMLDDFAITKKLAGRKYICSAIYHLVYESDKVAVDERIALITHISKQFDECHTAVYKAIQTAIKRAWRIVPTDELEKLYTPKVDYNTGLPTPNDFLYHMADVIKKELD
jgi:CheY-like chemotaxis protein